MSRPLATGPLGLPPKRNKSQRAAQRKRKWKASRAQRFSDEASLGGPRETTSPSLPAPLTPRLAASTSHSTRVAELLRGRNILSVLYVDIYDDDTARELAISAFIDGYDKRH